MNKPNILISGGSGLLGQEIQIDYSIKPTRKELDLNCYKQLSNYIKNNQINSLIHCGAKVGGVKANDESPHDFFIDNLQINLNILKACAEFKLNNSIFVLSTCIFPKNAPLPLEEKNINLGEPHETNFGYAYAKRILEIGSRTLKKQHNLKIKCLIPCNLYGKNDNYNPKTSHVIPSLIRKCHLAKIKNEPLVVWGDGNEERQFMFADDFAMIIKDFMEIETEDQNIIVSPKENYRIRDVVEIIVNELEFTGEVIYAKNQGLGVVKKPASTDVFRKYLSKFEFTPLSEGLKKTIKYYLNNKNPRIN